MELNKGLCFFCNSGKVISDSKDVHKIVKLLFNDSNINEVQLKNINPPDVCPVCYYKLILLKRINKEISTSDADSVTDNNCALCGSIKDIILVSKWNIFDKISSDFPALTSAKNCSICTACFFYLDTRNLIKEKLISAYPKLKSSHRNKSAFGSDITHHSTPILERKTRKRVETIDLTEEKSPLLKTLKLKTLKQDRDLKISKMVHSDPKFMDQILIVKLNTLNKSLEKAANIVKREKPSKKVTFLDEVSFEEDCTPRRLREREESQMKDEVRKSTPRRLRIREIKENTEDKPRRMKRNEIRQPNLGDSTSDEEESNEQKKSEHHDSCEWESRSDSPDSRKKSFFKIKLSKKKPKPAQKDSNDPSESSTPSKINLDEFKKNKLVINLERIQTPEMNRIEESKIIESEKMNGQEETSDTKENTEDSQEKVSQLNGYIHEKDPVEVDNEKSEEEVVSQDDENDSQKFSNDKPEEVVDEKGDNAVNESEISNYHEEIDNENTDMAKLNIHLSKEDIENEVTDEECELHLEVSPTEEQEEEEIKTAESTNEQNELPTQKDSIQNEKDSCEEDIDSQEHLGTSQEDTEEQENMEKPLGSSQEDMDKPLESTQEDTDDRESIHKPLESSQEDMESTQEYTDADGLVEVLEEVIESSQEEIEDTNPEKNEEADEIERTLASFEEESGIITLDSTADSNNSETGSKRKRCDSVSDVNDSPDRKKKKVTFSEESNGE